jgi:hypothetical protein
MTSRALFEGVCARSGLAAMIGPGTVQRALTSVGVATLDDAGPDDYRRALPQLRQRMAFYLPPEELERRTRDIEALLAIAESQRH